MPFGCNETVNHRQQEFPTAARRFEHNFLVNGCVHNIPHHIEHELHHLNLSKDRPP